MSLGDECGRPAIAENQLLLFWSRTSEGSPAKARNSGVTNKISRDLRRKMTTCSKARRRIQRRGPNRNAPFCKRSRSVRFGAAKAKTLVLLAKCETKRHSPRRASPACRTCAAQRNELLAPQPTSKSNAHCLSSSNLLLLRVPPMRRRLLLPRQRVEEALDPLLLRRSMVLVLPPHPRLPSRQIHPLSPHRREPRSRSHRHRSQSHSRAHPGVRLSSHARRESGGVGAERGGEVVAGDEGSGGVAIGANEVGEAVTRCERSSDLRE